VTVNNHNQPENPSLSFTLPDEFLEATAQRAAEILDRGREVDPWIGVLDAAEHLACPRSRIYSLVSARRIPFHKDGSRLLFRKTELDEWVEAGGARCP
jgi:excisionase family DNA binding protein